MTVTATTVQQPLNHRIEQLIRKAMNRRASTTSLGRAVKDAANEVAAHLHVQARDLGWDALEIEGIRHLTLATAADIARDLVADGYMTPAEFIAA